MRKTTIKDIANHVGVSVTTVSNVINGKYDKVSTEMRDIIHKAIDELNYVANYSARSLVKQKSNMIGVIIPQTEDYKQLLLQNPFYSELVSGIESKTRENGYYMMLSGIDKDKEYLDVFTNWNLDGAIIMGIYQERFYEELKKVKVPIVLLDSYIYDDYFYKIGIDDEYGGYLATKYLVQKGHKNIALITGHIRKDGVAEKRFLGYKRALKEAGIFYNSDYVYENSVSFEHGYEAGKKVAKNHQEITAIFAIADVIAAGVIKGLHEFGKKVPEDVSVLGFDNVDIAKMFVPSITTVNQNICLKGKKAAELLIDVIDHPKKEINKEIILSLDIVERSSVKNIIKP